MTVNYEILILTHGDWGDSLIKNLGMILGEIKGVKNIPLLPIDTLNDYYSRVEEEVKNLGTPLLIITDLYGGTTSNVTLMLEKKYDIKAVSGLSSALLLEAITNQTKELDDSLVNKLQEANINNCKVLSIDILK